MQASSDYAARVSSSPSRGAAPMGGGFGEVEGSLASLFHGGRC